MDGAWLLRERIGSLTLSVLVVTALASATACASGSDNPPSKGLSVSITAPEVGATVRAKERVEVMVAVEDGKIVAEESSDDPRAGHLHVFVDGDMYSMPTEAQSFVTLDPGRHTISVEFVAADHQPFEPRVTDSIEVTAEAG